MKSIRFIIILLIINLFSGISYSQNTIEPLIENLSKYIEKNHVSAAMISIVKSDTIFFSDGVGYADINKKEKVTDEQIFRHFTALGLVKPTIEGEYKLVINAKKEKVFKIEYKIFLLWMTFLISIILGFVFNLKNNRNSTKLYTLKDRKGIPEEDAKILIASLNNVMLVKKPYLNEDLTLKQLAQLIKTKERNLSKLLNINLNTNFYDYINTYRIDTFKQNIKTEIENYTIMGLAYDSGFKSKSSFYRVFKKITGSSPTEFKRKIE